jgi:MFS family permease
VTAILDREATEAAPEPAAPSEPTAPFPPVGGEDEVEPKPTLAQLARPLGVAALSSAATGLMTGGMFGSWTARLLGLAGAELGVAFAFLAVRTSRRNIVQLTLFPTALVIGAVSMAPTGADPTRLVSLMSDAVAAGRLLRPPVPFDPGWRPILVVVLSFIGLGCGWLAVAKQKPQVALVLPVVPLIFTAISQPAEGQLLGALLGFVPIIGAVGLLFGGDLTKVDDLGKAFEMKRLARAAPLPVIGVIALILLSQANFLFPAPRYTPADKPQKPKPIPLGKVRDRVLFTVDGDLTGPWKTGGLDFYDGTGWRIAPYNPKAQKNLSGDGVIDSKRNGDVAVTLTYQDLGNSSDIPTVVDPTAVRVTAGGDASSLQYDPRKGIIREKSGRVPQGLTLQVSLPKYPEAKELADAEPGKGLDKDFTYIPKAPQAVQDLIDQAPSQPWRKLSFLRSKLNEVVIAAGPGIPSKPVPPSKVEDLLFGSHEGSPFEIVAAEAMLARWAGVPSRIGYGFDGIIEEDGKKVVRPKLGSSWLEVNFEGHGWFPLIQQPTKAKQTLDADKSKFNPNLLPSDDVGVEVYLPYQILDLRQLYERLRALVLRIAPFAIAAVVVYFALPSLHRYRRRRLRRRWGDALGPREQIAVEYCELRDWAMDLNVGDKYATPLEYTRRLAPDTWHEELAWLVTRATYGDLRSGVELSDDDVEFARSTAGSLRRRITRAQPPQSRFLAVIGRTSLREPYSAEVPNVRILKIRGRRPLARFGASIGARGRRLVNRIPRPRLRRLAGRST